MAPHLALGTVECRSTWTGEGSTLLVPQGVSLILDLNFEFFVIVEVSIK